MANKPPKRVAMYSRILFLADIFKIATFNKFQVLNMFAVECSFCEFFSITICWYLQVNPNFYYSDHSFYLFFATFTARLDP